jgi:uncharacterized damage-inducible protein DinB
MSTHPIGPPDSDEYDPYFAPYIQRARSRSLPVTLAAQHDEVVSLLSGLSDEAAAFRYAPEKWSIKQVIGHLLDTERIFAYRALSFARGEQQPLPGFDQDAYVEAGEFDSRSLESLVKEYRAVRAATLALIEGFDAAAWSRTGVANRVEFSVRALAFIVAGHEAHHLSVLEGRYLNRG